MKIKVCSFCGHNDIRSDYIPQFNGKSGKLEDILKEVIIDCIENHNITEFYSSGLGDFDNLGARIICNLQKEYPHIKSVRVLNYPPSNKTSENEEYSIFNNYHETLVCDNAENVSFRARIPNCNKYMVSSADVIIAYVTHQVGGAYTTFKLATKQNKTIINLLELR